MLITWIGPKLIIAPIVDDRIVGRKRAPEKFQGGKMFRAPGIGYDCFLLASEGEFHENGSDANFVGAEELEVFLDLWRQTARKRTN